MPDTIHEHRGKTVITALDRLPYGREGDPGETGRVGRTAVPEGVTRRELYRDVILIALPSLIELVLTQLTSIADQMMVGNLPGQEGIVALTAVGLASQPKFLLMTMVQAMNVGATAVIARLNLLMSVLFMAVGLASSRWLISFMGGTGISAEALALGKQYLDIQLYGFIPLCVTITVTAALRGIGDTKTPMIYNTVANVINLGFNYVMIYGHFGCPKMGVAGASWATNIGQTVAFVIAMWVALGKRKYVYIDLREKFVFNRGLMGDVVNIGVPSMVEQLLMRLGLIIYTRQVTGLGDTVYATHNVLMSIQSMSFMMGQAFANAATTLMGQSIGKRRYDMSAVYMRRTRDLGIVASLFVAVALALLNRPIIAMFKNDPTVINMGAPILYLLAASQPLQADQFIVSGGLRGAGDTRFTAVVMAVTVLGLRSGLAILTINYLQWGLWGAWIALVIDQCSRTFIMALRYRSGRGKEISRSFKHAHPDAG